MVEAIEGVEGLNLVIEAQGCTGASTFLSIPFFSSVPFPPLLALATYLVEVLAMIHRINQLLLATMRIKK